MILIKHRANGFTLTEVVVSTLLLSIFALGSFKSSHYAQHTANISLEKFLRHNWQQQTLIINHLRKSYPTVNVDAQFALLKCLLEQGVEQASDCR